MERERGASDVRWKTVPQTSGCNRKRSIADGGQPDARTSRDIDQAKRIGIGNDKCIGNSLYFQNWVDVLGRTATSF